jgi:hypothetical protein
VTGLDSLAQSCGLSLPTLKPVRLANAIVPSRCFIACQHCQRSFALCPNRLHRLHLVRTGPMPRQPDADGGDKRFTGPVGPGKDVTDCPRVRKTSLEARHAHMRRSVHPIGTAPVPGRVSVGVSPLGIARSIHRSSVIISARLALLGAQCRHVGLMDCRCTPGVRTACGDLWRSLVHRWWPVAPPRLAPAINLRQNIGRSGVYRFARVPRIATKNSVGPRPASRVLLSNVFRRPARRSGGTPFASSTEGCRDPPPPGRRRIVHAHDPTPRSWQRFAAGSNGIEQRKMPADSLGRQR